MDHMKKKIFPLALALAGLLALAGCRGRSMDYIIENEPSIIGIVEEVRDDSVLMRVEMEGYPYGAECSVSLAVENSDSYTHLSPGMRSSCTTTAISGKASRWRSTPYMPSL